MVIVHWLHTAPHVAFEPPPTASRHLEISVLNLAVHPVDLGIVVAYVCGIVMLGIWVGRGQRDLNSYLLGSRDLPWWAILGSIVATETSTVTFLSVPGITFAEGGDLRFLQLAMGLIAGRIVVALVLLPQYFRGQMFTAYEVLAKRFGGATKQTASALFLVTRNLGDGLRLFLTAIVMEKVVGFDLATSIVLIGIATIVYTFFGGMKAVVWNDCIQLVAYLGGALLACQIIGQRVPGGWGEIARFAETTGRLRLFDFSWSWESKDTFWAGLIGGAFLTLGTHGTDQMMVQRYLSARRQRDAGKAIVASGLVVLMQFTLFLLLGIGLACFYARVAPGARFDRGDEVLATFIVTQLPVGATGVTLAAVFSAAMSTLSSSLHSSASAAVNDLYRPTLRKPPKPGHLLRVSRLMTVAFGVIQILVGIGASYVSRSVINDALAIAGFAAGILLGIFALGVLTTRVGQSAAMVGVLAGVAMLSWLKFATQVAWPWYAVLGSLTVFATGYLVSLLIQTRNPILDDLQNSSPTNLDHE
ncbi:MAG: sodium:solute symporter [Planctomycetales bacterium]|nr:sodium:solute symporter [Planctomycetales bacterium]